MCASGVDIGTTEQFNSTQFCHFYFTQRFELFDNLEAATSYFKNLCGKDQVSPLLYGSKTNASKNFN